MNIWGVMKIFVDIIGGSPLNWTIFGGGHFYGQLFYGQNVNILGGMLKFLRK